MNSDLTANYDYWGKLDPEAKKLWLKELRSGKHRQGKSALMVKDKRGRLYKCCLGVCEKHVIRKLPHIMEKIKAELEHSGHEFEPTEQLAYNPHVNGFGEPTPPRWDGPNAHIPFKFRLLRFPRGEWDRFGALSILDSTSMSAIGLTDKAQRYLAAMNDDGKTFEQIADWIEANL